MRSICERCLQSQYRMTTDVFVAVVDPTASWSEWLDE